MQSEVSILNGHPAHLPHVDGVRGYLIFAMTVGHFIAITQVGALNFLTHKPFALFLTGEGFMVVSGFMSGYILTFMMARRGFGASLVWGLRRSGKIVAHYLIVFALCALPALFVTLDGSVAALLFHGRTGFDATDLGLLVTGLYRPSFFDILYLYVVYIALAPLAVALFNSRLRYAALSICLLAWLFTQYGMTQRVFDAMFAAIPFARIEEAGAFHVFAWQLLFFSGVAVGVVFARDRDSVRGLIQRIPKAIFSISLTVLACFAITGLMMQAGLLPIGLRYLQDYLIVAPMPLGNFVLAVLAILSTMQTGGVAAEILDRVFRLPPLQTIGKVTLQSFSASIVLSYWVAYAVPAGEPTSRTFAFGSFVAVMIAVYAVSWVLVRRRSSAKRDGGRGDVPAPGRNERRPTP